MKTIEWDAPNNLKTLTLEDWFHHIDHVVNLVGPDHVGLGSGVPICGFPEMGDMTQMPNLTRGLIARGYSDNDIEKILGVNNLRVFKNIL